MDKKKVVVVMPAYNAAKTLLDTYEAIPKDVVDEIILVDDYSTDNTLEIAANLPINVISHSKNRGYGGNQKTCYHYAIANGADIIIMLHPDNQYDPTIISQLIEPLKTNKADVVFASRFLYDPVNGGPIQGGMPVYKFIFNRFLTFAENLWLGTYFSEFHTGYRAFSAKILQKIPFWTNSEDFVFDNEIIIQLLNVKARFKEVPVKTKYFDEASSISFKRSCTYGIGIFLMLLKYSLFKIRLINFTQFDFCKDQVEEMDNEKSAYKLIETCPNCGYINRHIEINGFPKWKGIIYKCDNCNLNYYDRVPEKKEITDELYEKFYDENGTRFNFIAENILKKFRYQRAEFVEKFINSENHQNKILDIGTDRGFFLNYFKERNWEVCGTQINKNTINSIKNKFNINVFEGELIDLDLKDNDYDVITAFHVLEHLKDPFAYLKKVYSILKPDGIFVLEVPNFEHYFRIFYGSRWLALDIPYHLYHFDENFLKKYLIDLGFNIEFISRFSLEFTIPNLLQSWLNLWHTEQNILIKRLLPLNLFKLFTNLTFYKDMFILSISLPFLVYQFYKLKFTDKGDTLRLVVRKK